MLTEVMKKTQAISTRTQPAFWKIAMAIGGMTSGILLMLAGLILWWISALEGVRYDYLGLILIAAAFGAFGIGAHGLDLVREAEIEERKRRLNL